MSISARISTSTSLSRRNPGSAVGRPNTRRRIQPNSFAGRPVLTTMASWTPISISNSSIPTARSPSPTTAAIQPLLATCSTTSLHGPQRRRLSLDVKRTVTFSISSRRGLSALTSSFHGCPESPDIFLTGFASTFVSGQFQFYETVT